MPDPCLLGPYPVLAPHTWGAAAAASWVACHSCHSCCCHSCCFHSCHSCCSYSSWEVGPCFHTHPPACRWGRHMLASCYPPCHSLGPHTGWGSIPWVHSCLVELQQHQTISQACFQSQTGYLQTIIIFWPSCNQRTAELAASCIQFSESSFITAAQSHKAIRLSRQQIPTSMWSLSMVTAINRVYSSQPTLLVGERTRCTNKAQVCPSIAPAFYKPLLQTPPHPTASKFGQNDIATRFYQVTSHLLKDVRHKH